MKVTAVKKLLLTEKGIRILADTLNGNNVACNTNTFNTRMCKRQSRSFNHINSRKHIRIQDLEPLISFLKEQTAKTWQKQIERADKKD